MTSRSGEGYRVLLPGPRTRWFGPALALVTLAAFCGRYVYLVRSRLDSYDPFVQGDAAWYHNVAVNASRGKWFVNPFGGEPTADHAPGTIVALWPSSWFGDPTTWKQRMTMVVIGTLVVLVLGIGGRIIAGPICGIVAAVVAAANPALWANDVLIMSESPTALACALLFTAVFAAYRLRGHPRVNRLVVAAALGVLVALCALTRAETGLLLPFVVWPLFLTDRQLAWRPRLAGVAVATVATLATIAPWSLYSSARFSDPVFISTNDGLTLMCANTDSTWAGTIKGGWTVEPCVSDFGRTIDARKPNPFQTPAACLDRNQKFAPCWDASRLSKEMRGEGLRYIREHLGEWPGVTWARHGRVWGWYKPSQAKAAFLEGRPPYLAWPTWFSLWSMLAISVGSVIVARRRRIPLSPFLGALVAVLFVTTAFYGLARFRIPVDVALCLLMGIAATALVERSVDWRDPTWAFPGQAPPDDDLLAEESGGSTGPPDRSDRDGRESDVSA